MAVPGPTQSHFVSAEYPLRFTDASDWGPLWDEITPGFPTTPEPLPRDSRSITTYPTTIAAFTLESARVASSNLLRSAKLTKHSFVLDTHEPVALPTGLDPLTRIHHIFIAALTPHLLTYTPIAGAPGGSYNYHLHYTLGDGTSVHVEYGDRYPTMAFSPDGKWHLTLHEGKLQIARRNTPEVVCWSEDIETVLSNNIKWLDSSHFYVKTEVSTYRIYKVNNDGVAELIKTQEVESSDSNKFQFVLSTCSIVEKGTLPESVYSKLPPSEHHRLLPLDPRHNRLAVLSVTDVTTTCSVFNTSEEPFALVQSWEVGMLKPAHTERGTVKLLRLAHRTFALFSNNNPSNTSIGCPTISRFERLGPGGEITTVENDLHTDYEPTKLRFDAQALSPKNVVAFTSTNYASRAMQVWKVTFPE